MATWVTWDLLERVDCRISEFLTSIDVDDDGASCVTQLQQDLFTPRAQAAAESGLVDAVRAINNLATAQVRKDSESHRCERPRLLEGIRWRRGGFPTVVEEDGGILRCCDQGVGDDVGVCS